MSLADNSSEYIAVATRATPSLAVTGATAAGWTLNDYVLIATLIYTALQTLVLVYNFMKKRRNGG
jgi:Phage holin family 6.